MAKQSTSKKETQEVVKGYLLKPTQLETMINYLRSLSFSIDQVQDYQNTLNIKQMLQNLPLETDEIEVEPQKAAK